MKKSGFTLIEILAVIIILGVIALIIIPRVNEYVSLSEEEAIKSSVQNIYKAANEYYFSNGGINNTTIDLTTEQINYKENIEKGSATYDAEGKLKVYIYKDGYCANTGDGEEIIVEKTTINNCNFK